MQDLVDRGLIRILDLMMLRKDDDGELEIFELSDLDDGELGELRDGGDRAGDGAQRAGRARHRRDDRAGRTAAVLVWENLWAAPFGSAVRHAGGQLVASGRIPIQAVLAAIEADLEEGA